MRKLYIDIDGIILASRPTKVANFAIPFIHYIIENFDCYWLTTHCKGNTTNVMRYLKKYFDEDTMKLLMKIKPTNWKNLKTEAIDFTTDFIWIEDNPLEEERAILKKHYAEKKVLLLEEKNPDALLQLISTFRKFNS
ncbi:MAG: hypothetical protein SGJ10_11835 [Bacteroidota bacterium]|nr:hypothetical protein [Bacteroidota bacterium]